MSFETLHPQVGFGGDFDWRDGVLADCPDQTMEECQVWYWDQLNADPERTWEVMRDYWFFGLLSVVISSPILLFTLPIQIICMGLNPEGSIPPVGQPYGTHTFLQGFNLFVARLYMPYNAFFNWLHHLLTFDTFTMVFNDYNLRYMTAGDAMTMFTVDWIMLVPIVLQAIGAFVVTLPAWPFEIASMSNKHSSE